LRYGWRIRATSLLAGCALWEIGARIAAQPFLPSFTATIAALIDLGRSGLILGSLATSVTNLAAGFALAILAGVSAGVVMARVRQVEAVAEPFLHALLAAPGMIYVPILFTLFGATRLTQVGSVFFHAVFVIAVATARALRPENAALTAMASSFVATERQIFWLVRWPSARPLIVSGLRVGSLLAVKGMINGEMFIAFTGLGALVRTYGARVESDRLLAMVIVIASVAMTFSTLVGTIEQRTVRAFR
jgi:NitT/TauT family transport system permease protein